MTTSPTPEPAPQQLSLLPVSELPVQFRLDQRTRQRGLAHIAQIRRQLAVTSGQRVSASSHPVSEHPVSEHSASDDRAA
jgi:hypothetical protein